MADNDRCYGTQAALRCRARLPAFGARGWGSGSVTAVPAFFGASADVVSAPLAAFTACSRLRRLRVRANTRTPVRSKAAINTMSDNPKDCRSTATVNWQRRANPKADMKVITKAIAIAGDSHWVQRGGLGCW